MQKELSKIFITVLILTALAVIETYTAALINIQDDAVSAFGFLASIFCVLLAIYGIYKTWFKQLKKNK